MGSEAIPGQACAAVHVWSPEPDGEGGLDGDGFVPQLVGSNDGQQASDDVPSLIQAYPFAQQPPPQQPPIVQHPPEGQPKVVMPQVRRGPTLIVLS